MKSNGSGYSEILLQRMVEMLRFLLPVCLFLAISSARAAELAGVHMPDQKVVAGIPLTLNGMGLRTYSILRIRIFVAGLYLRHPSHDAQAIMNSSHVKLLRLIFLHDVDASEDRKGWQKSFAMNCQAPCYLPPDEVARFLSSVPSMHKGSTADIQFTPQGIDFTVDGRDLGQVTDPAFARIILLGYIGPHATSVSMRSGILGLP
jgi:hypothetical protein